MLFKINYQFTDREGKKIIQPSIPNTPQEFYLLIGMLISKYFLQRGKPESAKEIIDWIQEEGIKAKPFMLKNVLLTALDSVEFDPKNPDRRIHLDAEEKKRRDYLADRIFKAKETIELSDDERILLKRLVNIFYPQIYIVRQTCEVLESPIIKEEKQEVKKIIPNKS